MITFTIPTGSSLVGQNLDVALDRSPTISYSVRTHGYSVAGFLLEQSRPDGINTTSEQLSFTLVTRSLVDIQLIEAYFDYLGPSGVLSIVYPEITKNIVIVSYNTNIINALYGDLTVIGELVFNA